MTNKRHRVTKISPRGIQYRGPLTSTDYCETEAEVFFDHVVRDQNRAHNCGMSERPKPQTTVSLGRHQRACSVCSHEQREEIESAFIGWRSPAVIAEEYGLGDRSSVYRHANALGLFPKRQRNIRAALERIIEKAGEVDVTAAAVVSAIQAYAKINAAGEWIDRTETTSMNDLFERMSSQELEAYAQNGTLPQWFRATVGAAE
jgi:hypothetical protein